MKAMTTYLAEHLPIIELLIEEFRLSIKDSSRELIDSLQLYGMDSDTVRAKLDMLGMDVGRLDETWKPSPQFYKLYRRLIRNRSTLGSVQTLARTGGQLEASYRTLDEMEYFKNLRVYRDYQIPHVFGSDGYFYMVYDPKYPLSDNALVNNVLPAGYCFLCVTQFYGYEDGDVIPYDTLINNASEYKDPFTEGKDNKRVYVSDFTDEIIDAHGFDLDEHRESLLKEHTETVMGEPKTQDASTWLSDIYSECGLTEPYNLCEDAHNRHGLVVEVSPWDNCIHEALTLSNVKGIMPQHDMGWTFGGLAIRDKTFGDLFRERDVRTQPKNTSWVELLNHSGEGRINIYQHDEHANIINNLGKVQQIPVRDAYGDVLCEKGTNKPITEGLIMTDSMQYHKDLIVSERQEFDMIYRPFVVDGGSWNEDVDFTVPSAPTDVYDVGEFSDLPTANVTSTVRVTASFFANEDAYELSCDIIADIGITVISVDEMKQIVHDETDTEENPETGEG